MRSIKFDQLGRKAPIPPAVSSLAAPAATSPMTYRADAAKADARREPDAKAPAARAASESDAASGAGSKNA
jgi:hypothetical protein